MAEITPAGRRQRDRVALRATIDSVIVAARYWRNAPDDPERRRKFLQVAGQAESRSAALAEHQPENSTTTCAFPGCLHPDHQRKDGDRG